MNKLHSFSFLLFALCSLLYGLCFPSALEARVKGKCKDCHDMHASEPFPFLTKGGCLGCHGQKPEGDENIITRGRARIPQVIHHMQGGDLAAGNFYYVADAVNANDTDYLKGHNVADIHLEWPPMDKPLVLFLLQASTEAQVPLTGPVKTSLIVPGPLAATATGPLMTPSRR
jgi:predicted CXXCH cytochrome family protein